MKGLDRQVRQMWISRTMESTLHSVPLAYTSLSTYAQTYRASLDLLDLPGSHCNRTTAYCLAAFPRGRKSWRSLYIFPRGIPWTLYPQLDLPQLLRAVLSPQLDRLHRWRNPDHALCRFFLLLHHQQENGLTSKGIVRWCELNDREVQRSSISLSVCR